MCLQEISHKRISNNSHLEEIQEQIVGLLGVFGHLEHVSSCRAPLPIPLPSWPWSLCPLTAAAPSDTPTNSSQSKETKTCPRIWNSNQDILKNNSYPDSGGAVVGGRFFNSRRDKRKENSQVHSMGDGAVLKRTWPGTCLVVQWLRRRTHNPGGHSLTLVWGANPIG